MKIGIIGLLVMAGGCDMMPREGDELPHTRDTDVTIDTDVEDTDEEDTGPVCDASDLSFTVEARDATGAVAAVFAKDDTPTLVGVVTNGCAGPVRFDTTSTCLVTGWMVTGPRGAPWENAPTCTPVTTSWTVEANGTQEVPITMDPVADKGSYAVQATFAYQDVAATTTFTVE